MSIQSEADLHGLRRAGLAVARVLAAMRAALRPGITTAELDGAAQAKLAELGARSAPRLFYRFPGATCISLNDEAVHGVPGDRPILAGDLVKLDVTAELDGYVADAAITVPMPPANAVGAKLAEAARRSLAAGLAQARAGVRIADVGKAIEGATQRHGFRVLRDLGGHGVGRAIHEEPWMPNFANHDHRRLPQGLVVAIEPIIAAGTREVVMDADGWTVRTRDGSLAAHWEHTIVIRRGRPLVLTAA
jgi:methionyl aminopeptidase